MPAPRTVLRPTPWLTRRAVNTRLLAGGAALLLGTPASRAADYPERPVKIIVNFPPGGPLDVAARLMAASLSTGLKQNFVVENVSGASGNIGAAQVVRATPDGHTLLMSLDTPFTMTPTLYPQTSVKLSELRPVASFGSGGTTVAVHPSLGVNTLKELIDKGRRDVITFATAGNGTPGHFGALVLAEATGVQANPIHYRGNAPAVSALVAGEVQAGVLGTPGLLPHIKAGKLKALAIAGSTRSALLPELATGAELGIAGMAVDFSFIAMAPAATPDAIVATLQKAMAEVMAQADFRERMKAMDVSSVSKSGAALTAELGKDRDRYAEIVRKNGLKGE